jgi:ribonuclease P protein component
MQRIRTRQQFQAVMAGLPVAKTPHFALHRAALDSMHEDARAFPVADAWLGVLLPKRWARRAVTRNAIRRQIYEAARAVWPPAAAGRLVVRLRSEFSRKQFVSATSEPLKRAVRAELQQLLGRVAPRPLPNQGAGPCCLTGRARALVGWSKATVCCSAPGWAAVAVSSPPVRSTRSVRWSATARWPAATSPSGAWAAAARGAKAAATRCPSEPCPAVCPSDHFSSEKKNPS